MTWKTIGHLFCTTSNACIISKPSVNSNWSYSPEALIGSKSAKFCRVWPWNLTDDLEKQWGTITPMRQKLYVSFQSHRWIQTGITDQKHPIRVKIDDLLSRMTLKCDRWPWKIIGHLFYINSRSVHHFVAICEFKLELQSGSAQFGSKSTIFCVLWPWNLTDDLEKQ